MYTKTTQAYNSFMNTEFPSNKDGVDKAVEYVNKLIQNVSKCVIKLRQIKTGRKRKKIKTFMIKDEYCHIRHQLHYVKILRNIIHTIDK